MIHIGPGAFFRAFIAVYTDEAIEANAGDWSIIGVSLKSTKARDALNPQGGVYSSVTLTSDGPRAKIINSVREILVAPENQERVIQQMSDPAIKIVSLTITEKGYLFDATAKGLANSDAGTSEDLKAIQKPASAIGLICAALEERRNAEVPPFTVLSCDNLPSNGDIARRCVLDYARHWKPSLADWIATHGAFPSTMVDRITPAVSENDIQNLADHEGYYDPACVVHEEFRQWIIEDKFVSERPAWESAGAVFVQDVSKHERMKLRCLNGTHSAMAYLGYLAGMETVSEAANHPRFSSLCRKLWTEEILPTLEQPEGQDLQDYCSRLMVRFRDPSIHHRLSQIAKDGSQKLPQRILATIEEQLNAGNLPNGLCLVVAAWIRFVAGVDERGKKIDVHDPMAEKINFTLTGVSSAQEVVNAMLELREIFGDVLPEDVEFRTTVVRWYDMLLREGSRRAVASYLSDTATAQD